MANERRSRDGDYRTARIGMAFGLTVAVVAMLLIDAVSPEYEASPIVLAILCTFIAGLVAVDLPDLIRPGGDK